MTAMSLATPTRRHLHARRLLALVAALGLVLGASSCGRGHPKAISSIELAEAQSFPYYRVYWAGPNFDGHPLVAADGLRGYIERIGDSVYYGDCVKGKGIFGGGTCMLPLQVTTVIYRLHSNTALGAQRNVLIRGVPATVYDDGHSIELYTGRLAIDVFSDTFAHELQAIKHLEPLNAPDTGGANLPPPIYCPGLHGPIGPSLAQALKRLPRHACQSDAAEQAFAETLST
jgi:hypothetical protein